MLSIENLQQGHTYFIRNHGEEIAFVVIEILANDCIVKSTETLEVFNLSDITRYGKGGDYELHEVE